MEIEIKIVIKRQDDSDFNKRQLISDIRWGFTDATGFEIDDIEVNRLQ